MTIADRLREEGAMQGKHEESPAYCSGDAGERFRPRVSSDGDPTFARRSYRAKPLIL
ncbi:Uncharacterised protein [Escherichia coli]|uniref:Uncharacterized protein n=1 Tax=Escherichia coli TaxID=562 RepID=A0A376SA30_ECOLX|nr:Uncharacterised protein [Escherichia coli]